MNLPRIALAVRQPWAWAIIHAGKDLENRDWKPYRADWRFRGRVAILSSIGMTRFEYADGADFMHNLGIQCPKPHELVRGAVIGSVEITGNTWGHWSPWYIGPGALMLRDPIDTLPVPATGQLGFFEWQPNDKPLATPLKWMTTYDTKLIG